MRLLSFIFLLVVLAACNPPEMPLPGITGKAGELVVVMDEPYWKSHAGDTVFNTLAQHIYGLPQAEPMFNVVHIPSSSFTKIFQTHRNLLLVNIGPQFKERIEIKKDVWATTQLVVEISAPSVEKFEAIFAANSTKIIAHNILKEQQRILKSYDAQLESSVVKSIELKYGLKMTIPMGYAIVSDTGNFVWLRHENKEITQNILFYSEPYTEQNTFTTEGMINSVNAFTKTNVPGPDAGTYMSIYQEYPPLLEETSLSGKYASRLLGLWNVQGAIMGGPFVSYSFLDGKGERVIHLHGFVFAPGNNKRNYLRQVDAIINSVEITR